MNKYNNTSSVQIKILNSPNEEDLYQLYQIHSKSLPDDILPKFGFRVTKKYITKLSESNNGKIIVALNKNLIIGFIFLSFNKLDMKKFLNFMSISKFLVKFFLKPKIIFRLIYQLLRPTKNPIDSCEVDYFAVIDNSRSTGIGKRLLEKAESTALQNNYKKIYTKTYNKRLYSYYINNKKASLLDSFKIYNHDYFCICWDIS